MADKKIRLRIVTPTRELYDKPIDMLIMRTSTGDMGVLYGHQPTTTTLAYGLLRIINGEDEICATVFGGFATITNDSVTIISDASEWPDEIDIKRAEEAKERAEARLKQSNADMARAELSLKRSLVRMQAKNYMHKK